MIVMMEFQVEVYLHQVEIEIYSNVFSYVSKQVKQFVMSFKEKILANAYFGQEHVKLEVLTHHQFTKYIGDQKLGNGFI